LPGKEFIAGHTVRLIHGGEEYFNTLLELIESAKTELHLQVYILDFDDTGAVVIDALRESAKRGVEVYLVADGFGSMNLGSEFKNEMRKYNIHFRFFSPLPFPGIFQAGRRLHHKVCVADSNRVLISGINIADKYRGSENEPAWLDYGLLVEGPVCQEITGVCERIFSRRFYQKQSGVFKKLKLSSAGEAGLKVRISINDWFRRMNEISAGYKKELKNAQKEIIIVASYFTPSRRLLKILLRSAGRNRDIYIVLSKYSDVPFMKSAMKFLYGRLLLNKVRIFEYRESVLHAKVCVVDNKWVSVGSHNLNHLSEFLSIEMNMEVLDNNFASGVATELKKLMFEKCNEILQDEFIASGTFFEKIKNWLSYKIISLSTRILLFLNFKSDKGA
jgi:cardiolipin synthase